MSQSLLVIIEKEDGCIKDILQTNGLKDIQTADQIDRLLNQTLGHDYDLFIEKLVLNQSADESFTNDQQIIHLCGYQLTEQTFLLSYCSFSSLDYSTNPNSNHHLDHYAFEEITRLNNKLINSERIIQKQNQELYQLTITDYLTKAYNRKYFKDVYSKLLNQKHVNSCAFYLTVLDINHFKRINDTYGHLKGDQVLIEFVDQMKIKFPEPNHYVIRTGGDEFVVLHTQMTLDEIKNKFDSIQIECNGEMIHFSIGTVCVKSDASPESYEHYMHKADLSMYQEKNRSYSETK